MTRRFVIAPVAWALITLACESSEPPAPAPTEPAPVDEVAAPAPAPAPEAPEPDDVAAALAPIDPMPAQEPEPEPVYTYQWMGKDGSLHLTQTPPPPGAKLMRKIEEVPADPSASAAVTPPPRPTMPGPVERAAKPVEQAVGVASWRDRASIGKRAPTLEGRLATGHTKSLESLRGEPVLVAFVTRTCPYCLKQGRTTAEVTRWGNTSVRPLTVIMGDEEAAQAFAQKTGQAENTILSVPASAFPKGGVPHSVLIDRDGVIRTMAPGYRQKRIENLFKANL